MLMVSIQASHSASNHREIADAELKTKIYYNLYAKIIVLRFICQFYKIRLRYALDHNILIILD